MAPLRPRILRDLEDELRRGRRLRDDVAYVFCGDIWLAEGFVCAQCCASRAATQVVSHLDWGMHHCGVHGDLHTIPGRVIKRLVIKIGAERREVEESEEPLLLIGANISAGELRELVEKLHEEVAAELQSEWSSD